MNPNFFKDRNPSVTPIHPNGGAASPVADGFLFLKYGGS